MQVQNKGHKNTELNVGGKIIHSDENGVYDVDDEMGVKLLALPGFHKPRLTVELKEAYATFKVASEALKAAQEAFDAAKLKVASAQVQAERGQGTPLDVEEAPAASPKPAKDKPAPTPAPKAADPQEDEEEAEDADEDELDDSDGNKDTGRATTAKDAAIAAKLKAKFGTPSMRWKSDDLISYANAIGVEADTEWSKADILKAIEDNEEE